jgi:hypothetical protein
VLSTPSYHCSNAIDNYPPPKVATVTFQHVTLSVTQHDVVTWTEKSGSKFEATRRDPNVFRGGLGTALCLITDGNSHAELGVFLSNFGTTDAPQGIVLTQPMGVGHRATLSFDVEPWIGDADVSIQDLSGRFSLLVINAQADLSWDGAFDLDGPLQIFQLFGTRLVNVTARYQRLIARDAAASWWLALHLKSPYAPNSAYATWVADECELGHGANAWDRLVDGVLQGTLPTPSPAFFWGRAFLRAARRALVDSGYCTNTELARVS